jgi:hypothetical protein
MGFHAVKRNLIPFNGIKEGVHERSQAKGAGAAYRAALPDDSG